MVQSKIKYNINTAYHPKNFCDYAIQRQYLTYGEKCWKVRFFSSFDEKIFLVRYVIRYYID